MQSTNNVRPRQFVESIFVLITPFAQNVPRETVDQRIDRRIARFFSFIPQFEQQIGKSGVYFSPIVETTRFIVFFGYAGVRRSKYFVFVDQRIVNNQIIFKMSSIRKSDFLDSIFFGPIQQFLSC
uniref:Uncharacterized protein n=1 Tax=Romanomermis culicivorax TaxID=13658 RepID=A0A915KPN7_ROMCU